MGEKLDLQSELEPSKWKEGKRKDKSTHCIWETARAATETRARQHRLLRGSPRECPVLRSSVGTPRLRLTSGLGIRLKPCCRFREQSTHGALGAAHAWDLLLPQPVSPCPHLLPHSLYPCICMCPDSTPSPQATTVGFSGPVERFQDPALLAKTAQGQPSFLMQAQLPLLCLKMTRSPNSSLLCASTGPPSPFLVKNCHKSEVWVWDLQASKTAGHVS